MKLFEKGLANDVLQEKLKLQIEATSKLEEENNKGKSVKRTLEARLYEDRIKRKRVEEKLEYNIKKIKLMEDTLKKEQTEKIGSHQSFTKEIKYERERRLRAEKEYVAVKEKHKETKAALTKLRLKQFKIEEEKKREDETNELNDSGIDFNISNMTDQKKKSPSLSSSDVLPAALLPEEVPARAVPRPQGPPGPEVPTSLCQVLHSASQTVAISDIMTEYAEKENNFELEEDYEDDLNDNVDFNEWGSNEEANDMENEELLEDENGVNSIDEEEEVKGGDNQADHIQNKRPKEVKRKRPKNLNKIKPTALKGPYHLDIEKIEDEYKDSPETINIIKKFPRLEYEIFNPVENKIPASKNHKFLHNLFNSNNAEETLQTFQLTRESFEEKYKTKFEEVDSNPTHGATGGRGKDTLKSGVLKIKSDVWVNSLNTIFNMLMEFVQDKQEFRFFNWYIATAAEIDLILGHFFLWMAPQEGGNSLQGTRYTTRTLKQIKTKIQNMLKHFLKRTDIDINSPSFAFTQNMYSMKRNKTAEEPMEGLQGDRERKAFEEEDKIKLDMWRTEPLDQVCTTAHYTVHCTLYTVTCTVPCSAVQSTVVLSSTVQCTKLPVK